MKIHPMWDTYPELQMELEKTVELIEKNIKIRNKEIEATILALIHSGGKLLRPAYSLLFSRFGPDQDAEKARAVLSCFRNLTHGNLNPRRYC